MREPTDIVSFVTTNESGSQSNRRPRPGPIGFSGENATSINLPLARNEGIGSASAPRKETPKGSRSLRVSGPIAYSVAGLTSIVLGALLLEPVLLLVGFLSLAGAYGVNRMNRTQRRIREQERQGSGDFK